MMMIRLSASKILMFYHHHPIMCFQNFVKVWMFHIEKFSLKCLECMSSLIPSLPGMDINHSLVIHHINFTPKLVKMSQRPEKKCLSSETL